MTYQIEFTKPASKQFKALPAQAQQRLGEILGDWSKFPALVDTFFTDIIWATGRSLALSKITSSPLIAASTKLVRLAAASSNDTCIVIALMKLHLDCRGLGKQFKSYEAIGYLGKVFPVQNR